MSPKTSEIIKARHKAGLSQLQAGQLIGFTRRAWQAWEYGQNPMRKELLELFRMKARK